MMTICAESIPGRTAHDTDVSGFVKATYTLFGIAIVLNADRCINVSNALQSPAEALEYRNGVASWCPKGLW